MTARLARKSCEGWPARPKATPEFTHGEFPCRHRCHRDAHRGRCPSSFSIGNVPPIGWEIEYRRQKCSTTPPPMNSADRRTTSAT